MNKRLSIAASIIVLALSACATKYQEMGLTGGVSAEPVSADTYRIRAQGNGYTNRVTIQDYVLLKAAETARAAGKTHFAIVGGGDSSGSNADVPGRVTTNFENRNNAAASNPGMSLNFPKPGQDVYVRVFTPSSPRQALPPQTFRAEEILANVGPRVQRSG